MGFRIRVISKTQQQARLADARVTNQHQLEDIVIFFNGGGQKGGLSGECDLVFNGEGGAGGGGLPVCHAS